MSRYALRPVYAAAGIAALALFVSTAAAKEAPKKGVTVDEAKIELGRRFFFDPAASRMGRHACADCHHPEHSFSDPRPFSDDDFGPTERHSQSLVDVGLTASGHWDGQFRDVRDLVRTRLGVGRRVGVYNEGSAEFVAAALRKARGDAPATEVDLQAQQQRLAEIRTVIRNRRMDLEGLAGRYREALTEALGAEGVNADGIAEAIHAYCGSIQSGESPYDRFSRGAYGAWSDLARRGFLLFTGRAGCVECHRLDGGRPRFTDDAFHDTGVAWRSVKAGESPIPGDRGRMAVTNKESDLRTFKTPSLREVGKRGPYMHDGSLATLEDVVRHYLSGPIDDPTIDPKMPKMVATADEVAAIVEFLRSLSSDARPGLATKAWKARATSASLTLRDAKGEPLARRPVRIVPAGDALPGGPGDVQTLESDASGVVRYAVPPSTHVKVVVDEGLEIVGGDLVPDTCREAVLSIPVSGSVRMAVTLTPGAEAPATLRAEHVSAPTLSIDPKPVTLLRLSGPPKVVDGRPVATYVGDLRDGVPADVAVAWRGASRTATLSTSDAARIDFSR